MVLLSEKPVPEEAFSVFADVVAMQKETVELEKKIDAGVHLDQVLERYAEYMNDARVQADGSLRDSDNWQKGMPLSAYMKSGWRHFLTWWKYHRFEGDDDMEE